MEKLTSDSEAQLATRITTLIRQEVREEAQLAEQAQNPGARLSQELVSIRAQLAALRWIQSSVPNPAYWKTRWQEAEQHAAAIEQFNDILKHPADEPTRETARDLLLCLHGQSSVLKWALDWLRTA